MIFGAKNNVATQVAPCLPWEFVPQIPENIGADKAKYIQWRSRPKTEHLVYTASEGTNRTLRCSEHNPVKKLHGLIVDYDASLVDDKVLERTPELYRPAWMSRSFSGGVRLVYLFEEPMVLDEPVLTKQFLKVAFEELLVKKLFANSDVGAFNDLTKLYDVGHSWTHLGDYRLSSNALNHWLFEASKKTKWSDLGEIKIPIELVAAEVERQFPGRWDGEFEVDARGVTFWDPNSTNPTSAIVTEAGMISFSQEQLFHSWAKIFGAPFVKKFQDDKIGQAVRDVWYDGKSYFQKINGVWLHVGKDDFAQWLRSKQKLDPGRGKLTSSEVDDAETFVKNTRRVAGVVPRVFDPREVIEIDGMKFLNNSYVTPVQPAAEPQEWGVNFPWIAGFLTAKFCDVERPYFFGWQKRFYGSALGGDLEKGHALFLVGTVCIGKTLLSHKIIGALVGGFADASVHISKGTEHNKELLEKGLWVVDDGEVATDSVSQRKFSEVVKKLVANPIMNYRAMFRDAQSTKWNGRLVVTLNDDGHSMAMIPDLEISMAEKVMILRVRDEGFKFPPGYIMEPMIAAELPYYGRWLLDYVVPPEIVGTSRLGVKGYINEDLQIKALQVGGVSDVLELIELWMRRMRPVEKYGERWRGTVSSWMAELNGDEALGRLVNKFTVKGLGRKFAEAARIPGSRISVVPRGKYKGDGNQYEILLSGQDDEKRRVVVSFEEDKLVGRPAESGAI